MSLSKYKTLIFDCDGVVLNSNMVKTQAFFRAAAPYGNKAAQALVDYHIANGGVSRYKKFEYFLQNLVTPDSLGPTLQDLLTRFAAEVHQGLLTCEVANSLQTLRENTPGIRWLIVSGGDQNELRDIFSERGISSFFDGGIYGSPDTKEVILHRELERSNILTPAILFGDSRYDHIAAKSIAIDFLFVHNWSEFSDYEQYCKNNALTTIASLSDLL